MIIKLHTIGSSLFPHKKHSPQQKKLFLFLPHVMLGFAKTHLCPTWKIYYGTYKDEIRSPIFLIVVLIEIIVITSKMLFFIINNMGQSNAS